MELTEMYIDEYAQQFLLKDTTYFKNITPENSITIGSGCQYFKK